MKSATIKQTHRKILLPCLPFVSTCGIQFDSNQENSPSPLTYTAVCNNTYLYPPVGNHPPLSSLHTWKRGGGIASTYILPGHECRHSYRLAYMELAPFSHRCQVSAAHTHIPVLPSTMHAFRSGTSFQPCTPSTRCCCLSNPGTTTRSGRTAAHRRATALAILHRDPQCRCWPSRCAEWVVR